MRHDVVNKITKGEYVTMRVFVNSSKELKFVVWSSNGVTVEEKVESLEGDEQKDNHQIMVYQLRMLMRAAEYENKGYHVIINPFTE